MRNSLFGLLVCFAGSAFALDFNDHAAVCEQIEANTTHAVSNDKEGRQKTCMCSLAEMEKRLEPEKYRMMLEWSLDAKAFALNNSDRIGEFMSEAMAVNFAVMKLCR